MNPFEGLGEVVRASVPQTFSFNLDQLVEMLHCIEARKVEIEDRESDGEKLYSFFGTPLMDVIDSLYEIFISYRFS